MYQSKLNITCHVLFHIPRPDEDLITIIYSFQIEHIEQLSDHFTVFVGLLESLEDLNTMIFRVRYNYPTITKNCYTTYTFELS